MRWLIGIWIVIKNTFGRRTGKDTPGRADAVNVKDAFVIIPGLMPSFRETFSASIFEVANWKLANKIIQIGIFIFKNVFGEYANSQSITMSSRALRKVQSFIAIMSPLIAHYSPIITASLLTDILIYFFSRYFLRGHNVFPLVCSPRLMSRARAPAPSARDTGPGHSAPAPVSLRDSLVNVGKWKMRRQGGQLDCTERGKWDTFLLLPP